VHLLPRSIRLALIAAVAACLVVAVPATAGASPAKGKKSHRLSPPKVKAPKKPSKRVRAKHRGPAAHAASCTTPTLEGDWRNINPSTNAMTRALVDFTCGGPRLCDIYGNCTGGESYYSTQMFGKCHPTDCAWGRVRAYEQYDGWIRSIYNFGFKTSHVWLKSYSYYGLTYLRVWVYNDFTTSDGRADYTTDEWMLR
jgi:hypothetical protein